MLFLLISLSSLIIVSNSLALHGLFTDNMVMQCIDDKGKGALIWGMSSPSQEIQVILDGGGSVTKLNAKADGQGHWEVNVEMKASKTPFTVNITDGIDNKILKNVLFGDVWLCSGQSNMVFAVETMYNGTDYEKETVHFPEIRLFKVFKRQEPTPIQNISGNWLLNSADDVKGFSAVCYASAVWFKKENPQLHDRPFGLIESCVGGTPVQAWMPTSALDSCGIVPSNSSVVTCGKTKNSVLFNGMIAPLIPFPLRGAMWYQGEANVGCELKNAAAGYSCSFKGMISSWRKLWHNEFTFLFVQLAAYGNPDATSAMRSADQLPWLRLNQSSALELPKVGQALAIDRGDKGSCKPSKDLIQFDSAYPGGIHPCNKTAVARRMALALNHINGVKGPFQGPVVVAVSREVGNSVNLVYNTDSADKMAFVDTEACRTCCKSDTPFEVLLNNGTYVLVPLKNIKLSGNRLTLTNLAPNVVGVRYAHQGFPQCVLSNIHDLPAPPFDMAIPN